jgi:hypothetical protein
MEGSHYIKGEIANDLNWVEKAPIRVEGGFDAKQTFEPWPKREGWLQAYICSWTQEEHLTCGCRRGQARLTSWYEHPFEEEDQVAGQDNRFPFRGGWYRRGDVCWYPWSPQPSEFSNEIRRWGTTQGLILIDMRPGYVKQEIEVCSWDEAWGGGDTPYTPSTMTNPWVPAFISRSPWFQPREFFETMERRRGAPRLRAPQAELR